MNPVIGLCPICGENLAVTKLHCRNCDTSVEGQFSLGRLYQLNSNQLQFVETFIRCEGKINRVEQEMGLSYPAVRARLSEVIRALGYEVGESDAVDGVTEEERREILNQLSEGEITSDEAVQLLRG
ncbi:MAG: DUF2089 domain-containing protein [Chloroflexota bacterium]|nr:MAG: DUF2089 domain-containing protein [Chloroflexota bacterium]